MELRIWMKTGSNMFLRYLESDTDGDGLDDEFEGGELMILEMLMMKFNDPANDLPDTM